MISKESPDGNEVMALKKVMSRFARERLAPKLEDIDKKIARVLESGDSQERDKLPGLEAKRDKLLEDYQLDDWLEGAARRGRQIQLVTHALKYTHQNAKGGGIFAKGSTMVKEPALIGSHLAGTLQANDVVGNAAALDVYKFLKLEYEGRSLLERILAGDADMAAALSDDPEQAAYLMSELSGIAGRGKEPASHKLAKQVFFPLDSRGDHYHLLAPLFPTSLVHAAYTKMREDRFSEEAKQARDARKKNKPHETGYRDYPNLAVQVFGGSKPQNISQLNSERHGENWLLSSLPPVWQSKPVQLPLGPTSIFRWSWFNRQWAMRERIKALAGFLGKTDYSNLNTRQKRARLVQGIVDEVLHFAAGIQGCNPGWTSGEDCRLHQAEALWLDPGRAATDQDFAALAGRGDWQEEVAQRFANWFNHKLREQGERKKLPMGEAEAAEWQKLLEKELTLIRRELAHV